MDTTQFIIVIVVSVLTTLFVVLGIQVFYILKEIRISIQKVNRMLDDMGKVSGTVGNSVSNLGGFINGLKSGITAITSLRHNKEE